MPSILLLLFDFVFDFIFSNFYIFNEGAVMKRLVAVAQLALCFVLAFCNSSSGQTIPPELGGHWVDGKVGAEKSMELFKDGTGLMLGLSISWKTENNRFIVLSSLGGLAVNYKVSGYQLILINDDGDADTLVRKEKYTEFKAKRDAAIEAEEAKRATAAEVEKAKQIAEAKRALEQLPKFTDSRDGKVYRKVTIGGKTWMAENLNFAAEGSKCYENDAGNCEKYGRLYNWATALKACPAGFHLPTDGEWTALVDYAGGEKTAGTKLKSAAGWNEDGNGTNDFGWSALPGGNGNSDGNFGGAGNYGRWWSATEYGAGGARGRSMYYDVESMGWLYTDKMSLLFSVRCVAD